MKDLKTILEKKETNVTLEPWAEYLKITETEIEYLKGDEVDASIKNKADGYGQSMVVDGDIYVCII